MHIRLTAKKGLICKLLAFFKPILKIFKNICIKLTDFLQITTQSRNSKRDTPNSYQNRTVSNCN